MSTAYDRTVWPVKTRVYPEGRTLYALAQVWPTKRAMLEDRQERWGWKGRVDAYSITGQWTRAPRERLSPQFGEANFYLALLDAETVSHEFAHVTWAWARRVGWAPEPVDLVPGLVLGGFENEERFCHVLSRMVFQFGSRLADLRLV